MVDARLRAFVARFVINAKKELDIFESLQIIALFIGVVGTSAAPSLAMPEASETPGIFYAPRSITEDTEMVSSLPLPGSENLDEKAIPLSKLVDRPFSSAGQNLVEKTQIPSELPGTKNLAEKRIPEPVLRKLYQRYQDD